jgi:hypothetical protein
MMILVGGTALHNTTIFHLRNPICEGKNTAVMRDHDDTTVWCTGTPLEKFQSMMAGLGIERCSRLVADDEFGVMD